MTVSSPCLSQSEVEAILLDRLPADRRSNVEEHISDCPTCREAIETEIGPDAWWNHLRVSLTGSGELTPMVDADWNSKAPASTTKQLIDLLGPSDDPEMLGRIGGYEVVGLLGQGGMGAVFKAFDRSLNRFVAIKLLLPHLAASAAARRRFAREGQAIAAVVDDHVMAVHAVDQWQEIPYLVMTYSRGASLQKRLEQEGPLELREILRIGLQTARGLAAAHAQGIVHRDVKPANIFLDEHVERVQLMDFGLARAADDASLTRSGMLAGTPQFMSPEQARGETVDHRSDLFSFGSILYMACTGRPAFRAEAAYGILRRITDTDPRPIREISPDIPEWLCSMIGRLMAKHPGDRFQSADEVAELLERCLAHLQQPTQMELPQSLVGANRDGASVYHCDSQPLEEFLGAKPNQSRKKRIGAWIMGSILVLIGIGFGAFQLTAPADISGQWAGEDWSAVSLSSSEVAEGWYSGSFRRADGNRGIMQLEWSRVHRRYAGRWKVGDQQAGALTLRTDGDNLRGAVAIDSDSPTTNDAPRLRDFMWQRPNRAFRSPNGYDNEAITGRQINIQSPIKGTITGRAETLTDNSRVLKGEIIVEISALDSQQSNRLADQVEAAVLRAKRAEVLLQAKTQSHQAAKESSHVYESQLVASEKAAAQAVESAKASSEPDKRNVEALQASLAVSKAKQDKAKLDLDRQTKLHEEGLVSEQKLQVVKQEFSQAKAEFAKAVATLESAKTELARSQDRVGAMEGQSLIENAVLRLNEAKQGLAKSEGELATAKLEFESATKAVTEMQTKAARQERIRIVAPVDGVVTNLVKNSLVKEGDVICTIRPEPKDGKATHPQEPNPSVIGSTVSGDDAAPADSKTRRSENSEVDRGTQKPVERSDLPHTAEISTVPSFSSPSDLSRRLSESAEKIATAQRKIDSVASNKKKFKKEIEQTKALIDKAEKQSRSTDESIARSATEQLGDFHTRLRSLEQKASSVAEHEKSQQTAMDSFKRQLAGAEDERKALTDILKTRLLAAERALDTDSVILKSTEQRVKSGDTNNLELLQVRQTVANSQARVGELKVLLRFYSELGRTR